LVEELPELGNFGLKLGLKLRELGEANLHELRSFTVVSRSRILTSTALAYLIRAGSQPGMFSVAV